VPAFEYLEEGAGIDSQVSTGDPHVHEQCFSGRVLRRAMEQATVGPRGRNLLAPVTGMELLIGVSIATVNAPLDFQLHVPELRRQQRRVRRNGGLGPTSGFVAQDDHDPNCGTEWLRITGKIIASGIPNAV